MESDNKIQHQKISIEAPPEALPASAPASAPVHRYRASRPWPVALLAAAAAGGAVLLTGGLSTAFTVATASAGAPTDESAEDGVARIAPRLAPASSVAAAPVSPASGVWHIQIGAFRSRGAAEAQLRATAATVPELAELAEVPQPWGSVTRARFGGIESEEAARRLCGRVMDAGGRCFPVAP